MITRINSSTSTPLAKIFDDIRNGKLVLPTFQRHYVWNIEEIVSLINSMIQNYYIGNIMVWNSKEKVYEKEWLGNTPQHSEYGYDYIIDGQQRITTLFALYNNIWDSNKIITKKLRIDKIHIVLDNDGNFFATSNIENVALLSKTQSVKAKDFFCRAHNSFNEILKWLIESIQMDHNTASKFANKIRNSLNPDSIIITSVHLSGFSFDDAILQFSKSNKEGKELSLIEIFSARFAEKDKQNLQTQIKCLCLEAGISKNDKNKKIIESVFLNLFSLIKSYNLSYKEKNNEPLNDIDISASWILNADENDKWIVDKILKNIKCILSFIINERGLGIKDLSKLPGPLCVSLIGFLILMEKEISFKVYENKELIKKYLIGVGLFSHFGSGTNATIKRDIINMVDKKIEIKANIEINVFSEISYKAQSAFGKSMRIFLNEKKVKSWYGEDIQKDAIFLDKIEWEHIFSKSFLKKQLKIPAKDKRVNSFANIAFCSKVDNLKKSDKSPKEYFNDIIQKINNYEKDVLEPQFIHGFAFDSLLKNDFSNFITDRAQNIYDAIDSYMRPEIYVKKIL